ncbi:MAG: HlyD family efflux transporter periplasmic adaptor subunit [Desulfobulbaceae bacterium]|nr:MAG: HlyD family efflux transporter periplasmic adaptor subunit [Desulfobulbaceae bacterium]
MQNRGDVPAHPTGSALEKPQFRSDLSVSLQRGGNTYIVHDPVQQKYFRLGRAEYVLCSLLDGAHRPEDAARRANLLLGKEYFDAARLSASLERIAQLQLFAGADQQTHLERNMKAAQLRQAQRVSRLNLMIIRLPLFDPHPWFSRIAPGLNWIPGWLVLLTWLALVGAGLMVLVGHWQEFFSQVTVAFSLSNLLLLYGIWFLLKVFHEAAHMVVCYRYGGEVHEVGVVLILLFPLTYVDGTTSWGFSQRRQRLYAAAAGLCCELSVAALATFVWAVAPQTLSGSIAQNVIIVAGVSSLLFNANPLMRFDGYYILTDLLAIPNLYSRGKTYVMAFWKTIFFGVNTYRSNYSGWQELAIRVYGVFAWLWRIVVLLTLFGLSLRLLHGFGTIIAASALIFWLGIPLWRLAHVLRTTFQVRPGQLRQFVITTVLLLVAVSGGLTFISWRQSVSAPAIVQYANEHVMNAQTEGFIIDVNTFPDTLVIQGDKLLRLENPELQVRLKAARLELEQREIESRMLFLQGDEAGRQSIELALEALRQEIIALRDDIAGLVVSAPVGGRVVGQQLRALHGTFISKGQELLTLVTEERKQLHASVSGQHIEGFRGKAGQLIKIDLRRFGQGIVAGTITQLSPRASSEIEFPAMTAIAGGPISVKAASVSADGSEEPNDLGSYEFFSPRFGVVIALPQDIGKQLRVGQVCIIHAQGPRIYLWYYFRELLRSLLFRREGQIANFSR